MPTEPPDPPHPLDAGLRAQAARRRADLGDVEPTMPGPMRTQLQSEIARQFDDAHRSRDERPGWLAWLFQWQRALATVAVAMLLAGLTVWNGGWLSPTAQAEKKKARLNETASRPAGNEVAAIATPAPASGILDQRSDAPAHERDAKEQNKPAAVAAAPAAPAAPATDALAAGKVAAAPKSAPVAPAATTAPAPVAGAPREAARSEDFASKQRSAPLRQNFKQEPAAGLDQSRRLAAKDEQSQIPLLNQFEFRQSGNRVEIVESDGSVYAGEVEVAKKDARAVAKRAKAAEPLDGSIADKATKPADAPDSDVAADFNFRASGMSNTLRQKVTIEGVYQAAAAPAQNAPGAAAAGGTATSQNAAEAGRVQAQQAQSRARVIGRAQVNGRNVDVQAEATK